MRIHASLVETSGGTATAEPKRRVAPEPLGPRMVRPRSVPRRAGQRRLGPSTAWGLLLGAAAFFVLLGLPQAAREGVGLALVGSGAFVFLGIALLSVQRRTATLNAIFSVGIFAWAVAGAGGSAEWGLLAHAFAWAINTWLAREDESLPAELSAGLCAAFVVMAALTFVGV